MIARCDLLRHGYLPEDIPPVFISRPFGDFIDRGILGDDYLITKSDRTHPSIYNATKRGHQRRLFSIPHPIAAADSTLFIDKYWNDIVKHMQRSPFSISRPDVDSSGARALAITPHNEILYLKSQRLAVCRYIARTDISRFFPSIYTHSLPWSFHGKLEAKKTRSEKSTLVFFNRIDFILRQAQDGQTIGIPVGPDWSRVIAEIIASAVDHEFIKRNKRRFPPMLRHVDDIWIGASTRDGAEHLLYTYRECLREFELDINELKTSIVPATDDLAESWPMELGHKLQDEFSGVFAMRGRRDNLLSVLDQVFYTANRTRDDGVIKFSIRRLDKIHAWIKYWDILEPFLLRCIINYPHSMDYIARVIAWRNKAVGDVNPRMWKDALNECISFHARLGNDAEVCWALWLARELNINLKRACINLICKRCSSLPLVILYDCCTRGVIQSIPDQGELVDRFGRAPLLSPFWFVAYEATLRNWIPRPLIAGNPGHAALEEMFRAEVSFYDETAVPKAFAGHEEEKWEEVNEAIEKIGGGYDDDEDDIFIDDI